jgi:hypothetical protein
MTKLSDAGVWGLEFVRAGPVVRVYLKTKKATTQVAFLAQGLPPGSYFGCLIKQPKACVELLSMGRPSCRRRRALST